jgi:hypothetical protein
MSITGLDKIISEVEEKIKSLIAQATGLDEIPKKLAEILDGSILKLAEGLADFDAVKTVVQVRTTSLDFLISPRRSNIVNSLNCDADAVVWKRQCFMLTLGSSGTV